MLEFIDSSQPGGTRSLQQLDPDLVSLDQNLTKSIMMLNAWDGFLKEFMKSIMSLYSSNIVRGRRFNLTRRPGLVDLV